LIKTDVLVVGSGAAGLLLALHCADRGLRVALATKGTLQDSNTAWAQGGVAAALNLEEDSPAAHVADTIAAGAGLCNVEAATVVAREAPERVDELARLGVAFTLSLDGGLALTREAAHSHARVAFASDHTGEAIATTLADKVLSAPFVTVHERVAAVSALVSGERCHGMWLVKGDDLVPVFAASTALATGGIGRVYARTTNPPGATGDGILLASDAGAAVADLEFVQFHPTALAVAGAPALLITEAARGEGAVVVDGRGRRFCFADDPRGELAPRDVVARSIFEHLQRGGQAFLDLRPIGAAAAIRARFPYIAAACEQFGFDIAEQPIPIAPAAHYHMGGVRTDLWGRTSILGLYAIGECACTGLHGANRLASNSLAECLVFAARAADDIANRRSPGPEQRTFGRAPETASVIQAPSDTAAIAAAAWDAAGVEREARGLGRLTDSLAADRLTAAPVSRSALEARAVWQTASLIARAALAREESRGSHARTDFPTRDDDRWLAHIMFERGTQRIERLTTVS